jgi:site-specific DNA recombinase
LEVLEESEINVEEALGFVDSFLREPSSFWEGSQWQTKLKLQWFQFPSGIVFDGQKFGTNELAFVFKTKEAFLPLKSIRVDPRRFELLTSALQKRRSTN